MRRNRRGDLVSRPALQAGGRRFDSGRLHKKTGWKRRSESIPRTRLRSSRPTGGGPCRRSHARGRARHGIRAAAQAGPGQRGADAARCERDNVASSWIGTRSRSNELQLSFVTSSVLPRRSGWSMPSSGLCAWRVSIRSSYQTFWLRRLVSSHTQRRRRQGASWRRISAELLPMRSGGSDTSRCSSKRGRDLLSAALTPPVYWSRQPGPPRS